MPSELLLQARRCCTALLCALTIAGVSSNHSGSADAADQPAAPAEWTAVQKDVAALASTGEYEKAYQQLTEFVKSHPDYGPAFERRAWIMLDWLDLRDEFSLVDTPWRRRPMPDPVAALGNIEPSVEARRLFLQDRFHETYTPPRQLKTIEQDLESARRLMGKSFDSRASEAFIAEFVGDATKARELIGARCESGKATAREQLTYCRLLRNDGSFVRALKAVDIAWKAPETRSQAASRKVNLLLGLNRRPEATALMKKWEQESPHDPRLIYLRSSMHADADAIIQDFDTLVTTAPKESGFFYARATRYVQFRKDTEVSLTSLNRAVELNPHSLIPTYARSCLCTQRKESESALEDATAAIERNPYFDLSYQLRSKLYMKQGQEELAKQDRLRGLWLKRLYELHAAAKAKPENVDFELALGEHYARGQEWKPALRTISACVKRAPRNTKALRERCEVYQAVDDLDSALKDANAIIEITPEPGNFSLRGDIHASRQDWNAAVADYERANCLDDRLPQALRHRAASHSAAGRPEAAEADLKRAAELSETEVTEN